ncbi:MAG: hypothetical protein JO051_03400 [Acidobacteriaceae bacterium]|nr:hypothetical protein [Acidobacteriaceae bacterium]
MALTANSVPSVPGGSAYPYDASLALCASATLTATGYLGSPTQLDLGLGRQGGVMVNDLSGLYTTTGDEYYRIFLLGSNDNAFGNGNVELLGMAEYRTASSNGVIATILGASPTVPAAGRVGGFLEIPFSTQRFGINYRYIRGYLVTGGTTPSITLTSWLTLDYKGGGWV